ncbi:MAG: hypothetical protein ACTJG2_00065 [Candidatus Saccharimonadales bacterium]
MMNKQQSGSVVSFVIVGVLLAILVVGGIVLSQRRGADHAVEQGQTAGEPTADPEETANNEGNDNGASTDQNADQDADKQAQEEEKQAEEQRKKEAAEAAERERVAAQEAAEQEAAQAAENNGPMARTGGGDVHAGELPETGPVEDFLMMTVGLIAIAGSGYVYYHFGYGRK